MAGKDNGNNGLYKKIVDFLMGEYFRQKNENVEPKRKEIELKAERLRLREESLKFRRDRFESWKRLMEDKGRKKENQSTLEVQLQREKLEFREEQFYLKERNRKGRFTLRNTSHIQCLSENRNSVNRFFFFVPRL